MTITCNSIMKKTYTIPQTEDMTSFLAKDYLMWPIDPSPLNHNDGGTAPGRISSDEVGPAGL